MRTTAPSAPRALRLALAGFALSLAVSSEAQNIATDASLGLAPQVLPGPTYEIGQHLGRVAGANLFHSFQRFGLAIGETARFRVDDAGLSNVFARVTGGQASTIAGAIETVGGAPALFLINPAGVVFSQGARIDVPGGLHVSTADTLRFPDGDFRADAAAPSQLSSARPEAFGFLGSHLASLRIEGVSLGNADGAFEAVAGKVQLVDGGGVFNQGGALRVVTFGQQAGQVPLRGTVGSAAGALEITNGGHLLTRAADGSAGGSISVAAGSLRIDGGGVAGNTGIATQAAGSAPAGEIEVALGGTAVLRDGGFVGSLATAAGDAGRVRFSAGELLVDGASARSAGISSDAGAGSTGTGSAVEVHVAGDVMIRDGGFVRASTFAAGDAGGVSLQARNLVAAGGDARSAGVFSNSAGRGAAGGVRIDVAERMALISGGRVQSNAFAAGDAGAVLVSAGELSLDGGAVGFATIASDASFDSSGAAGPVSVTVARRLSIADGGFISSSTFGAGNAGSVEVASGELAIDGGAFGVAGVFSDSNGGAGGAAGSVTVAVGGRTAIANGGFVTSSTFSAADAGQVRVDSGSLELDGGAAGIAEIRSSGGAGSSGKAGAVSVTVREDARLGGGARIRSGSFGTGDGGTVSVRAGDLLVEGAGAGFSGIYSETDTESASAAGAVDIAVDRAIVLRDGGLVLTSALGAGRAGAITMRSASLEIDGGDEGLAGVASTARNGSGSIELAVRDSTILRRGGVITTNTFGAGDAGRISLGSGDVLIEAGGGAPAAIFSDAGGGASGGGGSVSLAAAGDLTIGAGGAVSASTFSAGRSGTVRLAAADMTISGGVVGAVASADSSGRTGDIELLATRTLLLDDGLVSIENDATVADPAALPLTGIRLEAPDIVLRNGSALTAAASTNANASRIQLAFGRLLRMDTAAVSTTALDGNGGAIEVLGGKVLSLRNAGITTSVRGARGDGGDISIGADALILAAGFIQANTRAAAARGGRVLVDVAQVVPGGNQLFLGGDQPFSFADAVGDESFNVIQAAAPTGISGEIRVGGGVLDVAGSLVELRLPSIDLGAYARDPCSAGRRNTFAVAGRRDRPPGPADFQRVLPSGASASGALGQGVTIGAADCRESRGHPGRSGEALHPG